MRKLVMIPGPTNVSDRVMNAMISPIISHRSSDFHQLYSEIAEGAQQVFETTDDTVVLTSSGTGAIEASVVNLVRPGDEVIVPVFGEFGQRLSESIELAGGKPILIEAPLGEAPTIDSIEEAFEKHKGAKAVYVVCNETSTGVRIPWLKHIGELASKYGTLFVADAVSYLGGDELPVEQWGVDLCVTCSQKCLAAPPGLSLLSVSKKARKFIEENPPMSKFFDLSNYIRFYERKKETPFTPSLPLYRAIHEAILLVLEEGMERRIQRHKTCANAFYQGFKALGLKPLVEEEIRSNTVIAIRYPQNIDDKRFRKMLDEEFRITVAGGFGDLAGKIFRVGCMGEISSHHVLATLSAVASVLKLQGETVNIDEALRITTDHLRPLKSLQQPLST
ncbi:MAG: aminotransferase [Thaumarchaeota archaeon]|nr:aminotransferase [Nitrososphaerota archaeon]